MPQQMDISSKISELLSQSLNITLAIPLLYIIQYMLNSAYPCSCTSKYTAFGILYIFLIPFIMFLIFKILGLGTAKTFSCCPCCRKIVACSRIYLWQFFGMYLFWWEVILLDGDLYLCIMTKNNATLRDLPCKKNLSFEETMKITHYKNDSRAIGLGAIGFSIIGWWIISQIASAGSFCGGIWSFKNLLWQTKPYYKVKYESILSKEMKKYLEENLENIAKEKVEKLCEQHIQNIKQKELNEQQHLEEDVERAWAAISESHFNMSLCTKNVADIQ